jgi:hypothetical protein
LGLVILKFPLLAGKQPVARSYTQGLVLTQSGHSTLRSNRDKTQHNGLLGGEHVMLQFLREIGMSPEHHAEIEFEAHLPH